MQKFTKNFIDQVIDLYCNKYISIAKIVETTGISRYNITKILKDNNIEIINRQNQLNYDVEKDIIPLYNKGYSLTSIAKKFNTNRDTLSRKLKELGIQVVNHQNETKFNEGIFDVIDTEEKAYWLGFIFADGYISSTPNDPSKKSKYQFELSLKASDVNHLNKFNKFMEHNKDNVKIGKVTCNNVECFRCRWSVTNKHLWSTLNNLGCVPNKSLILTFPSIDIFKNKDLIRHFIRGYFDGDGCFSRTFYKDEVFPKCSFLGTYEFISMVKTILEKNNIHISNVNQKSAENVYTIQLSQNNSILLINYLYNDSTIYLDRKYNLYKFFCKGCRSVKEFTELLSGNIGEDCDVNTEISSEITKGSEQLQSVVAE